MKSITRIETYNVTPEQVFKCIDDLGVTGMHMTQSSMMMMGSKLNLEFLTENHTGLGSKYRWTGKIMGMAMDFTVEVTKWIPPKEKIWETIGDTKLIIYSWYRMHLLVLPVLNGCKAELSISYEKPKGFFNKILSFLFADWYCRWCLKNMLNDTKTVLEPNINSKTFFMKINVIKFGVALGLAFSIAFLLCNLILLIGGKDFSLSIMNTIFHDADFKSLMTDNGFDLGKLLRGMAALFIVGTFIGWFTAVVYNAIGKSKTA